MEPKITYLVNEPLSDLLTRSSLVLSSCILAIVLLSNVLERWVLPRVYGTLWEELSLGHNERRRRSFTYLHLGVVIMLTLMIFGAYPVFDFLVGHARLSSNFMGSRRSNITYGDYLFTLSQIYSAYYLFEMCFRTRFASPISIAHHIGVLIVIQVALALFSDLKKHPEAIIEFYMCMVWGSFDVVVELPLYTFMIVWRVRNNNHRLLSRMSYACCVWVLLGATVETAVTIWLLQRSWDRWSLSFHIILPLVFSLWISTQLYGAGRIFGMARSKARLANEYNDEVDQGIAAGPHHRKSREGRDLTDQTEIINRHTILEGSFPNTSSPNFSR
ncbi:hypothetical protein LCI18_011427 [Fusarium solani-melongenae]|uniref:Uncharacterized protein n=1 Tax=Fusarium solani subsp. cucurbitae TaxID=2747967 RepID=A0ACD3ZHC4_FUSSC|nr:hypothetical protein LCI18_011427 [Fusarium solani-melongenae]